MFKKRVKQQNEIQETQETQLEWETVLAMLQTELRNIDKVIADIYATQQHNNSQLSLKITASKFQEVIKMHLYFGAGAEAFTVWRNFDKTCVPQEFVAAVNDRVIPSVAEYAKDLTDTWFHVVKRIAVDDPFMAAAHLDTFSDRQLRAFTVVSDICLEFSASVSPPQTIIAPQAAIESVE